MTVRTETQFLKEFGKRLASLRKARHLSQEELASRADLHAVAITYIETGKRLPKLNTLYKLATGLGVSVEELFKGL
jgi:transcriptional regulator with XRE-family HTH domain